MPHRRMRDPAFRQSQLDDVYAPHVEPINRLVDRLRDVDGRGWMPHIAPIYGGVNASILLLLRDPARRTNSQVGFDGSGFLCLENDDATAERVANLLDEVDLTPADCTPWNAYPWYINQTPTSAQITAGLGPLIELLQLLDRLKVVLLLGSEAKRSWSRMAAQEPALAARVRAIVTRHTSHQAFIGTAEQRAYWKAEQLEAFYEAAAVAHGENPPPRVERESKVVDAFTGWLKQDGWEVATPGVHADVVARRGEESLIAEVKGMTSSPGLDVDTMYGQLLRRMTDEAPATRYAVVVPRSAAFAVARVPRTIRDLLRVDAFVVEPDGTVMQLR